MEIEDFERREALLFEGQSWRELLALYDWLARRQEWVGLVERLERLAAVVPDAAFASELLVRTAVLQDEMLARRDSAILSCERALAHDPSSLDALRTARGYYRAEEDWAKVEALVQRELELREEPRERAQLYAELAELHREHLGDERRAAHFLEKAAELDPATFGHRPPRPEPAAAPPPPSVEQPQRPIPEPDRPRAPTFEPPPTSSRVPAQQSVASLASVPCTPGRALAQLGRLRLPSAEIGACVGALGFFGFFALLKLGREGSWAAALGLGTVALLATLVALAAFGLHRRRLLAVMRDGELVAARAILVERGPVTQVSTVTLEYERGGARRRTRLVLPGHVAPPTQGNTIAALLDPRAPARLVLPAAYKVAFHTPPDLRPEHVAAPSLPVESEPARTIPLYETPTVRTTQVGRLTVDSAGLRLERPDLADPLVVSWREAGVLLSVWPAREDECAVTLTARTGDGRAIELRTLLPQSCVARRVPAMLAPAPWADAQDFWRVWEAARFANAALGRELDESALDCP